MTHLPRVVGLILIVLGVVVGAVGVIPSGRLAGQLNGVGGSDHLTADAVLLVGALLVLGGLVVALRWNPGRLPRRGRAAPETGAEPLSTPPPTAAGAQPLAGGPTDQSIPSIPSDQEALATGEPPEALPAVPPQPAQEGEEHEAP